MALCGRRNQSHQSCPPPPGHPIHADPLLALPAAALDLCAMKIERARRKKGKSKSEREEEKGLLGSVHWRPPSGGGTNREEEEESESTG